MPAQDTKADLVRFDIDLTQPTDTKIADTQIILDFPGEFPRLDERFLSKPYDVVWLNVMTPPEHRDPAPEEGPEDKLVWNELDGVAQYCYATGKIEYYHAGRGGSVQEPIFIPRSDDAAQGDGWVMFLVEKRLVNLCEVVLLDTRDFSKPIAAVQLPFHVKAQVHGNWIDQRRLKERKSLVREGDEVKISGKGALETWDV